MPAVDHATALGNSATGARGATIDYLDDPSTRAENQRRQLDLIEEMNRSHFERYQTDRRLEGAIESFELAIRMQAEVLALIDLVDESQARRELYGIGDKPTEDFGRQCLLA